MFENEEFDLDEDFLKDIGKKEEEYYSQKIDIESQSDPPAKRQKTEPLESDLLGDITFDDEPDFAKNISKNVTTSLDASKLECTNVSSRKKMILEIFNTSTDSYQSENVSKQSTLLLQSSSVSKKVPQSSLPNENLEISRKTLALKFLSKGSLDENSRNVNFSSPKSSIQREISSTVERNSRNVDYSEDVGRKTLVDAFKIPAEKSSKSPRKFAGRNSSKFSSSDRTMPVPRMTLVRKFPGPAGLLPDNLESNLDHANFLNGLDGCAIDEDLKDSKISEYCSQNTERLFSSGAWRLMLDDLPANFLKGYDIATIKRSVSDWPENSVVSFVAGVIQKIDQSVENPRLLLKDMTDSIEATMHSDIPVAHPNVLEPGVVILLRDAGLLGFQGSQKCPGLQYHLMIGLRNIIAVYSEKTCLVSSPLMNSMKKTTRTLTADKDTDISVENDINDENRKKILSKRSPVFLDHKMEISDLETDDEDIAFACFNLGDIKDSQTATSFSKARPKIAPNFPIGKNLENAEGRKNRIFGVDRPKVGQRTIVSPKIAARKSPSDKNIGKTESSRIEGPRAAEVEIRPKPVTGIRSRLLQFRSNDVLTPKVPEAKVLKTPPLASVNTSNLIESNQEMSDSKMGTFGDDLLASDNDTEDEILSQLDVDSIMTNYNAGT